MAWEAKPSMPRPASSLGAAVCEAPGRGTRIYAIGGFGETRYTRQQALLDDAAAYDTQTQTWTTVASMPTARCEHAVASSPGRVHSLGGFGYASVGGPLLDNVTILATHEVYRPADDGWQPAAPMPTPRAALAAATGPDGRVYAIGGSQNPFDGTPPLAVVEVYDPATDSWETRTPLPTGRLFHAATAGPDGRIYVLGGANTDPFGESESAVDAYDPGTDTWSSCPALPLGIYGLAAASGPHGLIFAIGGNTGSIYPLASTYAFSPANPALGWVARDPLSSPRDTLAAVTGPDGLVYAIGGDSGPFYYYGDTVEANAFDAPDPGPVHPIPIPILIGRLLGGVAADGPGGILVGDHYIPIPPRSPLMESVLEAAAPLLERAVSVPELSRLADELRVRGPAARLRAALGDLSPRPSTS